jgi:hypothetical protein
MVGETEDVEWDLSWWEWLNMVVIFITVGLITMGAANDHEWDLSWWV